MKKIFLVLMLSLSIAIPCHPGTIRAYEEGSLLGSINEIDFVGAVGTATKAGIKLTVTLTGVAAETDPIVGAVSGLVKSDGAGGISAITDSSTNWDTAYTHSQDNSQAHSDYMLNTGDTATGTYDLTGATLSVATPTANAHSATKEYVDLAVGFHFDYFHNDTASDIGGIYYAMTDSDLGGAESSLTKAALGSGDGQALYNFATLSGEPGIEQLEAGVYDFHLHAERTAGTRTVNLYCELYKYETDTTETLIATSEVSGAITSKADVDLHATLSSAVALDPTDRLVVKVLGNIGASGSAATVVLYQEGDTDAHFTFQTTSGILSSIFVRRDGTNAMTANWDIGNFDITLKSLTGDGTLEGAIITEGGNAVYNATETPGGELGNTWASPTIDDSVAVSSWNLTTPTITTSLTTDGKTISEAEIGRLDGLAGIIVTDVTAVTDIEGTGLSIGAATLNWSASGIAGHDTFTDFVANEHLDWTASVGTIHADNYIENVIDTLAATLGAGADANDVGTTSWGKMEGFDAGLYIDWDTDGVMNITSDGTLELHSADWDISTTGAITNATIEGEGGVISTGESGGNKYLREDGDGTSSWQTVTSSGASKALDDLASVAINESLISDTNNTDDLGSDAKEWKDIWIDGTAYLDTVDIDAGAIDGTTIGGASAAGGSFTTIAASSTVTLTPGAVIALNIDQDNNGTALNIDTETSTTNSAIEVAVDGASPATWAIYRGDTVNGNVVMQWGSRWMWVDANGHLFMTTDSGFPSSDSDGTKVSAQ